MGVSDDSDFNTCPIVVSGFGPKLRCVSSSSLANGEVGKLPGVSLPPSEELSPRNEPRQNRRPLRRVFGYGPLPPPMLCFLSSLDFSPSLSSEDSWEGITRGAESAIGFR